MVEHIVLFKWSESASKEAIQTTVEELKKLQTAIPGIVDLTIGEDFSGRSKGYHTALVVRFTDRAALEVYGPHPAHQNVVQNYIVPIREDVLAFDFEF